MVGPKYTYPNGNSVTVAGNLGVGGAGAGVGVGVNIKFWPSKWMT